MSRRVLAFIFFTGIGLVFVIVAAREVGDLSAPQRSDGWRAFWIGACVGVLIGAMGSRSVIKYLKEETHEGAYRYLPMAIVIGLAVTFVKDEAGKSVQVSMTGCVSGVGICIGVSILLWVILSRFRSQTGRVSNAGS